VEVKTEPEAIREETEAGKIQALPHPTGTFRVTLYNVKITITN
jgi:hypothetical protein